MGNARSATVKGIMFNVLQEMANAGGCSDDAWELVIEFAAAESLLECVASYQPHARYTPAGRLQYDAPAEAMVRCLSQDAPAEPLPMQALPPAHSAHVLMETLESEGSQEPFFMPSLGGGFAAEAFLPPDALLNLWGQELEGDWEHDSDDGLPLRGQHRDNSRKN